MEAEQPKDSGLSGQYQAIESLSHEELDSVLSLGRPPVLPRTSFKEKCKLIRRLLSARRLGNRVRRVCMEGRRQLRSNLARGGTAEGKLADLETAEADVECDGFKLLELPNFLLRIIVPLVVKEPKDGLRMMGICRRIRKLVLEEKLPVMTNLSTRYYSYCGDSVRLSYNRVVKLINLSASWLQSVNIKAVFVSCEASAEPVTALLPELRDLSVCQTGNGAWILSQFASVAPNVRRLTLQTGNFSDNVMDWIKRLPLEKFELICSPGCRVVGSFLSSELKSVKLNGFGLSFSIQVSAESVLSMLSRSSQTLGRLQMWHASIIDDCDLKTFDLNDCKCTFMDIGHTDCSAVWLIKLCHRNLTHLHLSVQEGQAALGAALFENGRFSLRNVLLRLPYVDGVKVMRALLSRNPLLEVVSLCSNASTLPPFFAEVENYVRGLRHLRSFVLYDCDVAHREAWLALFSGDLHPYLNFFSWTGILQLGLYWQKKMSVPTQADLSHQLGSAVEAVQEASRRMPGCVFRIEDLELGLLCSHFAFEGGRSDNGHCWQCDSTISSAGCCVRGILRG